LPLQTFGVYERRSSKNLKGPLRVVRLCILGVVVPTLILGVPLYLRYNVYGAQLYPLAMSDMRMIDNRVSTTWCQKCFPGFEAVVHGNFFLTFRPQLRWTLSKAMRQWAK
ncbi:hypothetical protein D910_06488, partial [Dendroctonus ponderosae]